MVNSTRYNSEPEREDNNSGERRCYLRRKPKARVVVGGGGRPPPPPYHAKFAGPEVSLLVAPVLFTVRQR
jgi:hypothetical protein